MNNGYFVSFEGQDASGKTELLHSVDDVLKKKGYKTKVVEEFSNSETGKYLKKLLSANKFLRFGNGMPSAFTETMLVASDMYFQDEQEIRPILKEGNIVLKERHVDTLFACQIPKIMEDYPEYEYGELHNWIMQISNKLYVPNTTFLLNIHRDTQIARIKNRGETVSNEDLRVFDDREEIYRELAKKHKDRIILFDNNKSIEEATIEIADMILRKYDKKY